MAIFRKANNWYIDYYINGRRKREKIGPNRRQAELVFQKRQVQIARRQILRHQKNQKGPI